MMVHPLHSISYVADIDNVLVMMAHVLPVSDSVSPSPSDAPDHIKDKVVTSYTPKMTCHVLDTENVSYFTFLINLDSIFLLLLRQEM